MLQVGTIAPGFSLPDQDGVTRMLSDYAGQWLLVYFYPKDDTPGCTTEACAIRDNMPFYEELGIAVVGISRDGIERHKAFKQKYDLPFELLSDTSGHIIAAYDADNHGLAARISYLIAPDGTIARSYDKVNPATHAEQVLNDLKELKQ
jgi:thioredoxin-dependent peroxiredoxin